MHQPSRIKIESKQGPAIISSLNGMGISATHALWADISAMEFFPSGVDSAYYVVTLSKSVSKSVDVAKVESELIEALTFLAWAWPFCGGTFMVTNTAQVLRTPTHTSNSIEVKEELLTAEGVRSVFKSFTADACVLATYSRPPLESATEVAKMMHVDRGLARLMEYHHMAWSDYSTGRQRASWFINLYKVRDFLFKVYGRQVKKTRANLHISKNDWDFVGKILNNHDLRHAEVTGAAPPVPEAKVARLFELAREWIRFYLQTKNLPVTAS
jgi:hypothetical protein